MKQARSKKRALCVWLPNWPIQRVCNARPELKRKPIVLYEEHRRGGFRVVACSRHARERGIAPEMPLAEATSLADVHKELHDPLADRKALERLAEYCEQFSPLVGLEEAERPESLLLDITGVAPLFHGEQSLAHRVQRAFKEQGYAARIAIADTVGAAWAIAHYAHALVAAPAGETLSALQNLPVEALRLPADTVEALHELGVERIEQLLSLPRSGLASRFDPQLLLRLAQATGEAPETIAGHRPPPEIEVESLLEYPLSNRDAIETVVARLIEQAAGALGQRQQGAIRLECEFHCESGERVRLPVGLFRATAAARRLLELTRMGMERVKLPGPVVAVRVSVLIAAALHSQQRDLFDERQDDKRHVGLLIDRLSNRLGHESVLRPVLLAEAQPECAYRYEPLAGVKPRRTKPSKARAELLRPLRLASQPSPLEVVSLVPDGPPIQLYLHGRPHRVGHAWGPERIQTGWWRGRYIQRDYYRVETTAGARYWIFRRLPDGKWFLHGTF